MSGKLQRVDVVTFRSELRLKYGYNHWKVVSERNASKESNFDLLYCVLHKLG
jgi:hypothetical protein